MEITELVWNLFLLLLPGVVATIMIRQVTGEKYTIFDFIVYAALLGISTFIIMELLYSVYNIIIVIFCKDKSFVWGLNLTVWDRIFNNSQSFNKIEIIVSYFLSIPLGVFYSLIVSKKLLNKLLKKLNLTNRYGDNDIWSFYLNSEDISWIFVRDKTASLTYYGAVKAYSESGDKREIVLTNVAVYNTADLELLYEVESVYLELEESKFSIESPIKTKSFIA